MVNKSIKITKGKLSIVMAMIAILFSTSHVNNMIMGEHILRSIGLNSLMNNYNSTIITLICSTIIFAFAVILALRTNEDLNKIGGKKIAVFTIIIIGTLLSNIYR